MGSLLLSSGSWCAQNFVCALQDSSLFPEVLWKSYNQIPLAFKVRFPGIQSLCRIPRLEAWNGVQKLHKREWEPLWYYFSPVCGLPTQWVWNLILLWLCPSYHLAAASSLSLDTGYLFLVGSSVLLSMVVQQLVVILVFSQKEMSAHHSTLPILNQKFP